MALNCAELETTPNATGGYDCKTWVEVQPTPLETLAITKEQDSPPHRPLRNTTENPTQPDVNSPPHRPLRKPF